jgi:diguanylate cyclase (GGDEF)-like protein
MSSVVPQDSRRAVPPWLSLSRPLLSDAVTTDTSGMRLTAAIGRILLALPRGVAEAAFVLPGVLISLLVTFVASGGPSRADFQGAMTIATIVPVAAGTLPAIVLMALLRALDRARREADRLARIDVLTGIAGRRHWTEHAMRELARARHDNRPAAVVVLDVDHFKAVNDELGHAAGDAVLSDVAATISRTLRPQDTVGRWGGEEFVALLPGSTGEEAEPIAERIRDAVASTLERAGPGGAGITVSIGVADAALGGYDLDAVVDLADRAMYRAKRGGRNRVAVARRADAQRVASAYRTSAAQAES